MPRKKPQANPVTRPGHLELDGKSLTLVYDFKALAAFEELTGINMLDGWNTINAKTVACFLFAGMLRHHEDIDIDWCFSALTSANYQHVFTTMLQCYKGSLPDKDKLADRPKPEND